MADSSQVMEQNKRPKTICLTSRFQKGWSVHVDQGRGVTRPSNSQKLQRKANVSHGALRVVRFSSSALCPMRYALCS